MEQEIEEIRERPDLRELRDKILSYPYVWATGIGYRLVEDTRTKQPAIIASVYKKFDEDDLDPEDVLPQEINGVEIDVIEAKVPKLDVGTTDYSPTRRNVVRPLAGGMELGRDGGNGTLGICAIDSNDDKVVLTNRHVVEGGSEFCNGTDGSDVIGNPLYAGSRDSNGKVADVSAVVDWTESEKGDLSGDWGIGTLDDDTHFTNEILGFGRVTEIKEPSFDDIIVASGRTTGLSHTELVQVDFEYTNSGCTFTDAYQYRNEGFSDGGDSGKLAGFVDTDTEEFHPFGLHFAGGSGSSYSYSGNLTLTMADAGLTLDQGTHTSPQPDGSPAHFEACIVGGDSGEAIINIANMGGSTGSGFVEVRNDDDRLIQRVHATLDAFEHEYREINLGDNDVEPVDLHLNSEREPWEEVEVIDGGAVRSMDYSPDGEYLAATVNDNKQVGLFDAKTFEADAVTFPEIDGSRIVNVQFSPDSTHIAYAAWGGEVYVYGPGAFGWEPKFDIVAAGSIYSVAWSPDGSYFAFGEGVNGDEKVHIYETDNWTLEHTIDQNTGIVETIDFSPDGNWLAYGTRDNLVDVYSVGSWNFENRFSFNDRCSGVAWSPGSEYLAIADQTQTISIQETGSWNNVTTLSYMDDVPASSTDKTIRFSNSGKYVAYGAQDGTAYVVETDSWSLEAELDANSNTAFGVAWAHDDSHIAVASSFNGSPVFRTELSLAGIADRPYGSVSVTGAIVEPPTIGGTVRIQGDPIDGAVVRIINVEDGIEEFQETTDSQGEYSVSAEFGLEYHVTVEYEDSEGNLYNSKSNPFIVPE